MLPWVSISVLATSHLLYLVPLVKAMRASRLPQPIDFVGLSAIAYFDLGMLCECLGFQYRGEFFDSFFVAQSWQIVVGILLMAGAPWLMRAGARLVGVAVAVESPKRRLRNGGRKLGFYSLVVVVCATSVVIPVSLATLGGEVWESRFILGNVLGPWILVLSLPMYLIAFYVRLSDAESARGKTVLLGLLASSVLATVSVGERTAILLPFLIVFLFGQKISWRRWVAFGVAGVVGAALLLPIYKPGYRGGLESADDLLADTVSNDFYRAPELATVLGMSSVIGTRVLSCPAGGYIYASLLFVPRAVAPFKGESTALAFTGEVMHRAPKLLDWAFGISAVSEALLNVGIVFTPCVLMIYGVAIGWLTRKSRRWTSLQIPLCLAAMWVFGYHLPSILQNFGAMAVVGAVCERIFTTDVGNGLALSTADTTAKA